MSALFTMSSMSSAFSCSIKTYSTVNKRMGMGQCTVFGDVLAADCTDWSVSLVRFWRPVTVRLWPSPPLPDSSLFGPRASCTRTWRMRAGWTPAPGRC